MEAKRQTKVTENIWTQLICPTGCLANSLSSHLCKNISLRGTARSLRHLPSKSHTVFPAWKLQRHEKNRPASRSEAGDLLRQQEIAKAVLFLASNEASFINGVEFFIDGGQVQI